MTDEPLTCQSAYNLDVVRVTYIPEKERQDEGDRNEIERIAKARDEEKSGGPFAKQPLRISVGNGIAKGLTAGKHTMRLVVIE